MSAEHVQSLIEQLPVVDQLSSVPQGTDQVTFPGIGTLHDVLHRTSELFTGLEPSNKIIALSAGAAVVGAALEYRAAGKIAKKQQTLVEQWGPVAEVRTPGRPKRALKALTSLAFVGGGLIGYTNATQWISTEHTQIVPPGLEVIIDKSGATLLDNQIAASRVTDVLTSIDQNLSHFDANGWMTSATKIENVSIANAITREPFGDALVSDAFSLGIDDINKQRDALQAGDAVHNNALIVITNGNDATGVLDAADIDRANSPVFVFDVAEQSTATAGLKALTEATNGQYFAADAFDTDQELKDSMKTIAAQVEASEKQGDSKIDWTKRLAVLGLSAGSVLAAALTRNKITTRFGIRKGKRS